MFVSRPSKISLIHLLDDNYNLRNSLSIILSVIVNGTIIIFLGLQIHQHFNLYGRNTLFPIGVTWTSLQDFEAKSWETIFPKIVDFGTKLCPNFYRQSTLKILKLVNQLNFGRNKHLILGLDYGVFIWVWIAYTKEIIELYSKYIWKCKILCVAFMNVV